MKLSQRYLLDVLFVIGGAFIAIAAMAFSVTVTAWVGFGVFTGLTVIAAASAILTRSTGQKIGHSVIAAVGLLSLILTGMFVGSALTWVVFASAVTIGLLALGDLTAHETVTENVVHRLEVTSSKAEASRRSAA